METRGHITASTGTLYVLTFVAVLCVQQPSIRDIEAPPERINLLRKVCGQTPLANDRISEEKKMRRRGWLLAAWPCGIMGRLQSL